MPHTQTQMLNFYALTAFRDTADKDYIHARMAYKAALFPQFHWSALHALEKYAKCILVLARIEKKEQGDIKHEVNKSLRLLSDRIDIQLSDRSRDFINRLEGYGARFRYLETSWFTNSCELADLDRAAWELRRYCNSGLYIYSENEFVSVDSAKYEKLKIIDDKTHENTFIEGGFIERILADRGSRTKPSLVWCNIFYSGSNRKRLKMPDIRMAGNSPLFIFKNLIDIDSILKYLFLPKEVVNEFKSMPKNRNK